MQICTELSELQQWRHLLNQEVTVWPVYNRQHHRLTRGRIAVLALSTERKEHDGMPTTSHSPDTNRTTNRQHSPK